MHTLFGACMAIADFGVIELCKGLMSCFSPLIDRLMAYSRG